MSFLIFVAKNPSIPISIPIDGKTLEKTLCPYTGPLFQIQHSSSVIFHRSLSAVQGRILSTPKSHKKEACAAWVDLLMLDNEIQVETDPMGQCPIWFYDGPDYIAVSPEQKAFQAIQGFSLQFSNDDYFLTIHRRHRTELDFNSVHRLSPGARLTVNLELKTLVAPAHFFPWDNSLTEQIADTASAQDSLKMALMESSQCLPNSECVGLLSGGIDSSVACFLARRASKNFSVVYNLKTELGDEEAESKETAAHLGLDSKTLYLEKSSLLPLWSQSVFMNELTDGLTAEIILQMRSLAEQIPKTEKNIVTGYGADLLFGGMLGHAGYLQVTGVSDTASLLNRTFWSKEFSPFYYWSLGKRMFHLYWHPAVIDAALKIPLSLQQQQVGTEKYILRSLAVRESWLSQKLAFRAKKGMTNGTNVNFLFSDVLKLKDEYSFSEKTRLSVEKFKSFFRS